MPRVDAAIDGGREVTLRTSDGLNLLIKLIRTVDVPTVIVYGTEDTIVPPQQSISVADAAPAPTTVVEVRADHNDQALLNGRGLVDAVVDLSNGLARN